MNIMLDVVPHVDLEKYLGKWYEIAYFPAKFQEGCSETTAIYALMENGNVSVLNECKKNGKTKLARGSQRCITTKRISKLESNKNQTQDTKAVECRRRHKPKRSTNGYIDGKGKYLLLESYFKF